MRTLQSNFTEIALRHGCSPVNLLYIFRAPFLRTPMNSKKLLAKKLQNFHDFFQDK